MSNILVVPDVHLKFNILYPIIKDVTSQNKVDKLVFLGDYFDDWGQQLNNKLYEETCDYLKKLNAEYDCIFLLGNHDVPYITRNLQHYSNHDPHTVSLCRETLLSLDTRIAYAHDGILYSHAGFISQPDGTDFRIFTDNSQDHYVRLLAYEQPYATYSINDNPFWIRPDEWQHSLLEWLPTQVVGHSPIPNITTFEADRFGSKLVVCDTFSNTSWNQKIGNYALVLVKDGVIERIY